jgi:hypothetical protein
VRTPANEFLARLSPDGQWLSYLSNKSGQPEVYVDAFPRKNLDYRITTDGADEALWHRNGRQLIIVKGSGIWMQDLVVGSDVKPGASRKLPFTPPRAFLGGDLTPDAQRAIVAVFAEDSPPIFLTYVTGWESALANRR